MEIFYNRLNEALMTFISEPAGGERQTTGFTEQRGRGGESWRGCGKQGF